MIAIVYIGDIKIAPFIEKYIDIFSEKNKDYEIIFWNRSGEYESEKIKNAHVFNLESKLNKIKFLKIFDFLKYRKFILNKFKENQYEKIIVLTTMTGIIIIDYLIKNYKNKYIYDIRDYSFEKIKLFNILQKKLIKNSYFTCISSQGFKNFLPKNETYYIAHNFRYKDIKYAKNNEFVKKHKDKINIVYIGAIRQYNHILYIIDRFKNDKRFEIYYIGEGSAYEQVKNFCDKNNYENIHILGRYNNDDKFEILKKADVLNNHYELTTNTKYATANKYYDGLIYKIPQIANVKTYDGENINKEKIGLALDLNLYNAPNILYEYYMNIDEKAFNNKVENLLKNILKEDEEYLEKIKKFCEL